jgi:hypothetical protein
MWLNINRAESFDYLMLFCGAGGPMQRASGLYVPAMKSDSNITLPTRKPTPKESTTDKEATVDKQRKSTANTQLTIKGMHNKPTANEPFDHADQLGLLPLACMPQGPHHGQPSFTVRSPKWPDPGLGVAAPKCMCC